MELGRRERIFVGVAAGVLVAGLAVGLAVQRQKAQTYRRQLEYAYTEALGQLAESTAALAVDLEKACYAGSDRSVWQTAARLWRECGTARAALAALPLRQEGMAQTAAFLARAGDYAMALAGQGATADRSQLAELLPYAQQLAEQTDRLEVAVLSGEVPVTGLALGWLEGGPSSPAPSEALAASANGQEPVQPGEPGGSAGESAFAAMEEGFAGLPRLIYDGPFSTHLEDADPAMLRGRNHISPAEAKKLAATVLDCPAAQLTQEGDENGALPAYRFSFEERTAAITKQGGFLLYLADGRQPGGETVTIPQAKDAAQQFLDDLGYHGLESSYHQSAGGLCIFNFAAVQDGVTCYPDLIKVGVALDSGKVIQLDARGYLTHHRERSLAAPTVTARQAAETISPQLALQSQRLALIPSPGGRELLCHELRCLGQGGRQVLVYRNAATGQEEQLLLLEEDENGTLTV